jgi:hypothetical protein
LLHLLLLLFVPQLYLRQHPLRMPLLLMRLRLML